MCSSRHTNVITYAAEKAIWHGLTSSPSVLPVVIGHTCPCHLHSIHNATYKNTLDHTCVKSRRLVESENKNASHTTRKDK